MLTPATPRIAAARTAALPLACAGVVALALNLPTAWDDFRHPTTWAIPLELVAAGLVVLALGPRRGRAAVGWLAGLLTLLIALRWADFALWVGFGRPLSLATDLDVLPSLLEVVSGSFPPSLLALIALAAVLAASAVFWTARTPLVAVATTSRRSAVAAVLVSVAVAAACVQTAAGAAGLRWQVMGVHGFRQVATQVTRFVEARHAAELWRAAAANDPAAAVPSAQLLAGLAGVDVVVVFVESYGRTALTTLPGHERILARLATEQASLEALGLHTASGWLRSPTVGGQSWLAHATLSSGVWTDNQASHVLFLRSDRAGLAALFRRAGHRTVLAAPAWIHPFPEAAGLGFDEILDAEGLGYRGPPFGWVNIPDQFTLERIARAIEAPSRPRPISATTVRRESPSDHALPPGDAEGRPLRTVAAAAPAPGPATPVELEPTPRAPASETEVVEDLRSRTSAAAVLTGSHTDASEGSSADADPGSTVPTGLDPHSRPAPTDVPSCPDRSPVYAQVALIGSHAPFTPVLPIVADWSAIGDGTVFRSIRPAGGSPQQIWSDSDRLREAYAASIEATLELLGGFARRLASCRPPRPMLVVFVGDHEPAAIVTGDPDARTVPLHIVTSDRRLLEPLQGWGLADGMTPDSALPVHGMDAFRELLVDAYGQVRNAAAGPPHPHPGMPTFDVASPKGRS